MTADNKGKKKRIAHKGISIIEIIVILAIIVIMGGTLAYNVFVTNGYHARQAKNVLASQISEMKVRTLSKAVATGDVYMKVYMDGNVAYSKVFYKEGGAIKAEEPVELGRRIGIVYGGNSLAETAIGPEASTGLVLCFNRSTGALMKYTAPSTLSNIEYIKTKVFEKEYVIELIPATGKVINRNG